VAASQNVWKLYQPGHGFPEDRRLGKQRLAVCRRRETVQPIASPRAPRTQTNSSFSLGGGAGQSVRDDRRDLRRGRAGAQADGQRRAARAERTCTTVSPLHGARRGAIGAPCPGRANVDPSPVAIRLWRPEDVGRGPLRSRKPRLAAGTAERFRVGRVGHAHSCRAPEAVPHSRLPGTSSGRDWCGRESASRSFEREPVRNGAEIALWISS